MEISLELLHTNQNKKELNAVKKTIVSYLQKQITALRKESVKLEKVMNEHQNFTKFKTYMRKAIQVIYTVNYQPSTAEFDVVKIIEAIAAESKTMRG